MSKEIDIAALRKRITWDAPDGTVEVSEAILNALLDRLEQAEKDAARWRHGAEHGFPVRWQGRHPISGRILWTHTHDSQEEYQTADDVVDAAMKLAAMQGEGA